MSARWKSVATPPINFEQTYKETAVILIFLRTNYTTSAFLKVNKHIAKESIYSAGRYPSVFDFLMLSGSPRECAYRSASVHAARLLCMQFHSLKNLYLHFPSVSFIVPIIILFAWIKSIIQNFDTFTGMWISWLRFRSLNSRKLTKGLLSVYPIITTTIHFHFVSYCYC